MAFTVKQVAAMSGVSVRTLHFYDETGLLKPAYYGANGYRFYEEPQLFALQQILFYRELGFELKQIKGILGRPDFEIVGALQSHRKVLQKNVTRTREFRGVRRTTRSQGWLLGPKTQPNQAPVAHIYSDASHVVIVQAVARDASQPCRRQRFRRLHARDGRRLQKLRAIQTASLQMKAHEIRHVVGRGIERA